MRERERENRKDFESWGEGCAVKKREGGTDGWCGREVGIVCGQTCTSNYVADVYWITLLFVSLRGCPTQSMNLISR